MIFSLWLALISNAQGVCVWSALLCVHTVPYVLANLSHFYLMALLFDTCLANLSKNPGSSLANLSQINLDPSTMAFKASKSVQTHTATSHSNDVYPILSDVDLRMAKISQNKKRIVA